MKLSLKKAAVFYNILLLLVVTILTPIAIGNANIHNIKSNPFIKNINFETKNKYSSEMGWYWLESYSNYAPHSPGGVPDFNQHQNEWKTIFAGENKVIDSRPLGDDFYNPTENCITPGSNCRLETNTEGDDIAMWTFAGPASVADCFWWIDSKYSDPQGSPGDGEDNFPLVQDYGAGDDHLSDNVPLLIEKLANTMKTISKGKTYIQDMMNGIDNWFNSTNLSNKLSVKIQEKPTFNFINNEIKNNSNVILQVGQYKAEQLVDQIQSDWDMWVDLTAIPPGNLQNFTPSVSRLNAIDLLLVGTQENWTTVEVAIYDNLPNDPNIFPLGVTYRVLNLTINPEWVNFQFDPYIALTPGRQYTIAVRAIDNPPYNIHWCHTLYDIYTGGSSWWCVYDYVLEPKPNYDFAFKTLYIGNDCTRYCDNYITISGINYEELKIAICDPYFDNDNATPSSTSHNNPLNVSHDQYDVIIGSPSASLPFKWWLPNYPGFYQGYYTDYTVVEQAIIIYENEKIPPSVTITKPTNGIYFADHYFIGFFLPLIIGKITIEAAIYDNESGINRVEFSINDEIQETLTEPPYQWEWKKHVLGIRTIQVSAFDNSGNKAAKEISVLNFF